MSLGRTNTEITVFSKLHAIDKAISENRPGNATWFLEEVIRNIKNTKRVAGAVERKKIEDKIQLVIEKFPEEKRIHITNAMYLESQGHNKSALLAYKYIESKFPSYWKAYLYHAVLLQELGMYAESIAILDKLVNFGKDNIQPAQNYPSNQEIIEAGKLLDAAREQVKKYSVIPSVKLSDGEFRNSFSVLAVDSVFAPTLRKMGLFADRLQKQHAQPEQKSTNTPARKFK